jgi:hypothetical protein
MQLQQKQRRLLTVAMILCWMWLPLRLLYNTLPVGLQHGCR